MSMRWPAAMVFSDLRMNSRGGRRCRMALTVVSTTVGLLRRPGHQPGQRGDAGCQDLRIRPDAVVGHRIPGREGDHPHLRREEFQPLGQRLQPPVVAGNVQQQRRRIARALRLPDQLRQHQRPKPIRHPGEDLAGGLVSAFGFGVSFILDLVIPGVAQRRSGDREPHKIAAIALGPGYPRHAAAHASGMTALRPG